MAEVVRCILQTVSACIVAAGGFPNAFGAFDLQGQAEHSFDHNTAWGRDLTLARGALFRVFNLGNRIGELLKLVSGQELHLHWPTMIRNVSFGTCRVSPQRPPSLSKPGRDTRSRGGRDNFQKSQALGVYFSLKGASRHPNKHFRSLSL